MMRTPTTILLHWILFSQISYMIHSICPAEAPTLSGLTHLRETERIAMRTNLHSYTVDAPQANETSTIPATMSLGRTFIVFSIDSSYVKLFCIIGYNKYTNRFYIGYIVLPGCKLSGLILLVIIMNSIQINLNNMRYVCQRENERSKMTSI